MPPPQNDTWTVVPSKKAGKRGQHSSTPKSSYFSVDKDATVKSIHAEFDKCKARWLKNEVRQSIFAALKNLNLADRPTITKAICMGVGSLCSNNLEHRGYSMTQLVVFLDIVDYMHREGLSILGPLALFAQEPRFTAIDKDFLTSIGLTTLEISDSEKKDKSIGPASTYIDEHTFVADFFIDICVTQQMASWKIGLLTSALPRAIEENISTFMTTRDIWLKHYRWCKLTSYDEPALGGLYACVLREEEDA